MLCGKLSSKNNSNQLARKKKFYYYKGFLFAAIIPLLRTTIGNCRIMFQLEKKRRVRTRKKNSIFSSRYKSTPKHSILIQLHIIYSHERGEGLFENNV